MTRSPSALASSPVLSEELLSQTIISCSQPISEKVIAALRMHFNERSISFSSLKAGTTMEIFTWNQGPKTGEGQISMSFDISGRGHVISCRESLDKVEPRLLPMNIHPLLRSL